MAVNHHLPTEHPEQFAAEQLARVCRDVALHTRIEKFALESYVQAMMTQCACQVLVDLLRQKNIFGDLDMQKRLADAYLEMAKRIEQNQLLTRGVATLARQ